jgi:hypothetical protein
VRSTTTPEARLYRKSKGSEAKLSYLARADGERNRQLVSTLVTEANETAEPAHVTNESSS